MFMLVFFLTLSNRELHVFDHEVGCLFVSLVFYLRNSELAVRMILKFDLLSLRKWHECQ